MIVVVAVRRGGWIRGSVSPQYKKNRITPTSTIATRMLVNRTTLRLSVARSGKSDILGIPMIYIEPYNCSTGTVSVPREANWFASSEKMTIREA